MFVGGGSVRCCCWRDWVGGWVEAGGEGVGGVGGVVRGGGGTGRAVDAVAEVEATVVGIGVDLTTGLGTGKVTLVLALPVAAIVVVEICTDFGLTPAFVVVVVVVVSPFLPFALTPSSILAASINLLHLAAESVFVAPPTVAGNVAALV